MLRRVDWGAPAVPAGTGLLGADFFVPAVRNRLGNRKSKIMRMFGSNRAERVKKPRRDKVFRN
jgi:hypothetical protein